LNKYKSASIDQIQAEVIHSGDKDASFKMQILMNSVWYKEELRHQLKEYIYYFARL
jgi:hypothetical protein